MAILVMVTIPEEKSEELVKVILDKRLCACVNIIRGVQSFFWWKDKIDEANEVILIIKTRDGLFSQLKKVIKEHHPYTVPEIIAFKIDKINREYLEWLNKETTKSNIKY